MMTFSESNTLGNNSISFGNLGVGKIRSVLSSFALASLVGGVSAAEPLISESEFPITRKAVCVQNNMPVLTAAQISSCESFVAAKKGQLNDLEKAVAVDGVCLERYRKDHISYYETCRRDLRSQYKMAAIKEPPEMTATKSTAVGSCAKGAAVGVGTLVFVHGLALLADFMGCAGACSVAASHWTVPSAVGAATVGCAGGVAVHVVDSLSGDEASGTVNQPLPRPRPSK